VSTQSAKKYGLSATGVVGGGLKIGLGVIKDGNGDLGLYFEFGGGIGLELGVSIDAEEVFPGPDNDNVVTVDEIQGTTNGYSAGFGMISFGTNGTLSENTTGIDKMNINRFGEGVNGTMSASGSGSFKLKPSFRAGASWIESKAWTVKL
jgi:hypothetical protein|tara:strand:- start:33422 stop:33868 length:447 start_codon:yes stop_codon:yes gene_type:complete